MLFTLANGPAFSCAICFFVLLILLVLGPLLLALHVASQLPGAPRGQRRRPHVEEGEEPPSNKPTRHRVYGMIALLSLCAGRSAFLHVAFPFARFQPRSNTRRCPEL
jgi:hypothetical protein